ncbi:hypothetical protein [Demequina sp.]|uniref:hypothetical protein n=1 Tax=Demequina sp. TaxID=2050685 RepID=UPI0025B92499|nr:hypothetical protein [Demequina sp.]
MSFVLLGVLSAVSVWFAWRRAFDWLIVITLIAGVLQRTLVTFFHEPLFVYTDDITVSVALASACLLALSRDRRAFAVYAFVAILAGVAYLRAADPVTGFAQLRQVLLPLGLLLVGRVLAGNGRRIGWAVIGLASFSAVWALLEVMVQRPLLDPSWYATDVLGASGSDFRHGLPAAYYADGVIGGEPLFRAGGPFFNPPMLALFLAGGAYAAMRQLRGLARIAFLAVIAAALAASFGRAGMLIFATVTILELLWQKVNHLAVLVGVAVVTVAIGFTFMQQGNTSSHPEGFFSGLTTALANPFGIGFGSTGYQAALRGGEVGPGSESLLGLYFAWLGLPLVLLVIGVVVWLCRALATHRLASIEAFMGLSLLTVAALSESASALGATAFLWYSLGVTLARQPGASQPRAISHGDVAV